MKVTLITACLNSVTTIADTIESVLEQSLQPFQYIVVDGGSVDGTLAVVESYRMRFEGRMQIVSEVDEGIYDAYNKGVALSNGEVVGFLNADDRFASSSVLERMGVLFENPTCMLGYADMIVTDRYGERIVREWRSRSFTPQLLSWGWMPPPPTLYVRKELFDRIGCFDVSYPVSADYDFIVRAFLEVGEKGARYLPECTILMRNGGVSTRMENIPLMMRENWRTIRTHRIGGVGTLIMKKLMKIPQFLSIRIKKIPTG